MEITFKDKKLESIIQDPRKLRKRFNKAAEQIENRLEVAWKTAKNLAQVSEKPPTRRHLLKVGI